MNYVNSVMQLIFTVGISTLELTVVAVQILFLLLSNII